MPIARGPPCSQRAPTDREHPMGQTPNGSTQKPKKKPFWSFFMWWKTDPAEIETQVANYDSLVFWQSARGISMVLCLLSAAATGAFSPFLDLSREALVAHVVTCAGLGFAMFR